IQHHVVQHQLHAIEREFTKALRDNELKLFCQPQINASGFVVGVEMLTRWDKLPENITLEQLFDIVEDAGLSMPHSKWMFREACSMVSKWVALGVWGDKMLSLNITAAQLRSPDF